MKTIKIFLASSEELKPEREMMASLANSLNTVLEKQGIQVIAVEWENLDASMGPLHKQEDYNIKLKECEMCMVLYWTKFGMYTKTELDTAFNELNMGNNPRKVYVYFKESDNPSEELKAFRDSFPTKYGHFYTPFANFDTLKAHFLLQFMEYQSQTLQNSKSIEVKDGKVIVGNTEYVNLEKVPFAGNNEEYNLLLKNIKKTKKLIAITDEDDTDYAEYVEELQQLQEKLAKMESSLWDTALMITRLSTTKCSDRLNRAMDLFSNGDNKGAQAILNEDEIEKDIEHNLNLIKLGEEGRKGIATNIEEYRLKIKTLEIEMSDEWYIKVDNLYRRCIELGKDNISQESYAYLLAEYGDFLSGEKMYDTVESVYAESLNMFKELNRNTEHKYSNDIYWNLRNLSEFYINSNQYETADKCLKEIWQLIKDSCDSAKKGETLYHLAYLHSKQLKDDLPEKELKQAIQILESEDSEEGRNILKECFYHIGLIHKNANKFDLAREEAKKALKIHLEDNNETSDVFSSRIYELLGHTYSSEGRIDEAIKMYSKCEEVIRDYIKKDPNAYNIHLVCALGNLSYNNSLLGNYELAIEELSEALEITTKLFRQYPLQYSEYYARILHDYAYQLKNAKRYKEAIDVLSNSIEAYDILKNTDAERHLFQISNTYNLLGCIHLDNSEYEKAKEYLTQALELRQELGKKYGYKYNDIVAQTLTNIALLNCNTYHFQESEKQYLQLIDIYKNLSENFGQKHECDLALVYLNLGWLFQKQRIYGKSIQYGKLSIDTYKSVPDSSIRDKNQFMSLLAKALHNISVVYFKKDMKEEAFQSINESIGITKELAKANSKFYAIQLSDDYNKIAWFYYKLHDNKSAEPFATKSTDIAKEYDIKPSIRMSLDTLACIHRDLDKIELAEKEFTECIKLCRELRDNSPQFYDGKLAHEYIELAKIKGDKVQRLDLLTKAKELLNKLDDNHLFDFKEDVEELQLLENEYK